MNTSFLNILVSSLMLALFLVYGFVVADWLPDIGVFWMATLGIPLLVGVAGAFLMVGSRASRFAWTVAVPIVSGMVFFIWAIQRSSDPDALSIGIVGVIYWIVSSAVVFLIVDSLRKKLMGSE